MSDQLREAFYRGFYKRAASYTGAVDQADRGVNVASDTYAVANTTKKLHNTVQAVRTGAQTLGTGGGLRTAFKTAQGAGARSTPLLGPLVNGAMAVNHLRKGDFTGAAIDGLGAAAGAVPLLGAPAAFGLAAYNNKREAAMSVPNPAYQQAGGGGGVLDNPGTEFQKGIPTTVTQGQLSRPPAPIAPRQPVQG